jgi:predicted ester cyclase
MTMQMAGRRFSVGRESEEGESMSTADNKALVRRFWEGLVGTGNSALADELLAPGYSVHYAGNPPMDRDGFLQFLGALRTAFPDVAVTVEDLLAEGDEVAVRWTWRGTQQGLFRIANGRIVEDFVQEDTFGLLQQLGAIPAPGQPTG